ncbi:MAG: hypothetical protein WC175_03465 [Candidatus Dojkabacteria bacterium]
MKRNVQLMSIVDSILSNNEKTRADDKLLIFEVWRHIAQARGIKLDPNVFILLQDFFPDTITRVRRKLNQEGLYLPPKEVQMYRKRNEIDHREEYRTKPDKDCPVWINKDGEKVEVFRMDDEYIKNVINFLEDKYDSLDRLKDLVSDDDHPQLAKEMMDVKDWLDIFKHELRNRIGKEISDKRVDELELDKNFTQPEYKNLDRTIPVCSNCGAVDHTPFDNRHYCDREYQEENMEHYD